MLALVRDYETTLDRNRIVALHDGHPVGRLDDLSSALLSFEIDAGQPMSATVTEALMPNEPARFQVSIEATVRIIGAQRWLASARPESAPALHGHLW